MTMRVMVVPPVPSPSIVHDGDDAGAPIVFRGAADTGTGPRLFPLTTLSAVPLYAAYGSNMDPEQMMQRAPHSPMAGTGWLEGWRLTFGGEDYGLEGALSTVVEDPESRVFVVLYDVSPLDVDQLDRWEGGELGMHKKLRLRIQTMDGPQLAWVYVLDAYEGGLPSARYIGVLAEAAEAAGAPDDYVRALRERPCRSVGPGPGPTSDL
jgi:gamma-glutamylcyclotransferase (GGCT)/AIG2-like uncharacterized protein YtfP